MDNREPGWHSALSYTQRTCIGMVLIGMVRLLLETLMRVLLFPQLTTLDPASDDVDSEQMHIAVCVCVCARSCINFQVCKVIQFFVLILIRTMYMLVIMIMYKQ